MDAVEFAERFMNIELKDWQKVHLRKLEDHYARHGDIRIVTGRNGQVYIYLDQKTQRGLIHNG